MKTLTRPGVRRTIFALLAITLLASLSGCAQTGGSSAEGPTPTPLPTPVVPEKPVYVVERGTVVQTLTFNGRASAVLEQELYFESEGNVGEVFLTRGDTVQEGDMIAQLDIDDLQTELDQAELSLQITELKVAQSKIEASQAITDALEAIEEAEEDIETATETAEDDLTSAQADLVAAQVSLDEAKISLTITEKSNTVSQDIRDAQERHNWFEANYGEYLKKFEAGQCDQDRLDKEWAALLTAKEDLDTAYAQSELALSQAYAKVTSAEEALRQAQIAVDSLEEMPLITEAEEKLEEAQEAYEDAVAAADPEGYDMLILQLDLDNAKLDVEELETWIANSTLVAPFSGKILSLEIDEGDEVESYESIGVLVDPDDIEITAELGTDELSEMVIEQDASIVLRNRPGETYAGTIAQMPYPYGGTTVDTGDDDTAVHVALNDQSDLELGELATVTVIIQEREDVLWLPLAAIRTYQGRDFVVFQEDDGSQRRADIQVGIVTDDRVEITEGVEEGQVILGE